MDDQETNIAPKDREHLPKRNVVYKHLFCGAIFFGDTMEEMWKPILGYEDKYNISNFGRVLSLPREVKWKNAKRDQPQKILKPYLSKRGYLVVGLHGREKILSTRPIHLLVWDAFGDKPRNKFKQLVDHIDENKTNNRIDNLQVLTNRQNISKSKLLSFGKTSKFIGVSKDRGKWQSAIRANSKSIYLGRYHTEIEAHQSYQKALEIINICESKNYVIPNLKKQVKKTHEQEVCKVVSWTEIKC